MAKLAAFGTPLNVFTELPTFARGEKAKALADDAARARRTTFFIVAMVELWDAAADRYR